MKFFHLKIPLGLITLGRIWCPVSTFACFRGRAFLGIRCSWQNWINQFGLKQGCCPLLSGVNSDCCFFCASFGRSLCHGDQHHGIDPNMSSSGHHDRPQRLRANCNLPTPGFATRTIPHGAPLPTEDFKITIMHAIGCSLNLHKSYYCSSVFWECGQRLVEYGQAIDPQILSHALLQATRTFWLGPSPAPRQWT